MPGTSGFQATRAISRDEATRHIPVIMCSTKNQETDRIWGMRQGAKDYVLNTLKDPTVANSPLIFPTAEDLASAKQYKVFKSTQEEDDWNGVWQPVYNS